MVFSPKINQLINFTASTLYGAGYAGFTFVVTDRKHRTSTNLFQIRTAQVVIEMDALERLTVGPGGVAVITNEQLNAKLRSVDPWQIIFSIQRPPKLGRIFLNSRPTDQFTQADLNAGKISYNQTEPLNEWRTRDGFHFQILVNVSVIPNNFVLLPLEIRRFKIFVTFAALRPPLEPYVRISPLKARTGGETPLNESVLNISHLVQIVKTPLMLEFRLLPSQGQISFRNKSVDRDFIRFTADDLRNGVVIYRHQGLRSTDSMRIAIAPINGVGEKDELIVNVDVQVTLFGKKFI